MTRLAIALTLLLCASIARADSDFSAVAQYPAGCKLVKQELRPVVSETREPALLSVELSCAGAKVLMVEKIVQPYPPTSKRYQALEKAHWARQEALHPGGNIFGCTMYGGWSSGGQATSPLPWKVTVVPSSDVDHLAIETTWTGDADYRKLSPAEQDAQLQRWDERADQGCYDDVKASVPVTAYPLATAKSP